MQANTERQTEKRTHAYCVRHRNGWGTGCGPRPTHCHECGNELPVPPKEFGAVGYGCSNPETVEEVPGFVPRLEVGESYERSEAHCYACCAARKLAHMHETGRGMLYLVRGTVTDWAGKLKFPVLGSRRSAHNIARTRDDVWFRLPGDRRVWHGVRYGEMTQIAHCRRTKREEV